MADKNKEKKWNPTKFPWNDKSSISSMSDYGIKYDTRVFGGKRVKIDPSTGLPLTKEAEREYYKLRKNQVRTIRSEAAARNRQLLIKGAGLLDKGLNIASGGYIEHKRKQNQKLMLAIANSQYSNVPVEHYSKKLLDEEGINPSHWLRRFNNTKDVLTIGEQKRLDLRHQRYKEIAEAEAARERKAGLKSGDIKLEGWQPKDLNSMFGNTGLYINQDMAGGTYVTLGSNAAGNQKNNLNINPVTPSTKVENQTNSTQVIETDQGDVNVTKELKNNNVVQDKVTTKEDKKTSGKKEKGMFGLTIQEWAGATKSQRRRAKQLSNNNANVSIRGKGTVREMLGFPD